MRFALGNDWMPTLTSASAMQSPGDTSAAWATLCGTRQVRAHQSNYPREPLYQNHDNFQYRPRRTTPAAKHVLRGPAVVPVPYASTFGTKSDEGEPGFLAKRHVVVNHEGQ